MGNKSSSNVDVGGWQNRGGIVLLVTLVLLVVLSTLGYTLSSHIAAQRHRAQYIIDYQAARYACDSAVKYALATLEDISPEPINRPEEPDFSDLFHLTDEEYEELLAEWGDKYSLEQGESFYEDENYDINDTIDGNYIDGLIDFNEPNSAIIRGPYGPPWPLVAEVAQFEVGSARVQIEIEDENAKYPVGWMLLRDKNVEREVMAGFKTFCEWMDVNEVQIDSMEQELGTIRGIKPFYVEFKPRRKKIETKATITARAGRKVRRRAPSRFKMATVSVAQQVAEQATDLSRIFHSSLIDIEALARPTIVTKTRKESPLKYTGIWGSAKVNINTAPRHVLEAAFAFGGDADRIAEKIIQRRRVEPFKDIDDLKESLFGYSDSIRKCEKYITTVSNFFTIRVNAVSGVAEVSSVIAITKEGNEINKVAVISG